MEWNEVKYQTHTPGLKESWSNGMIAFAAHPPIKRKTPCYLAYSGCHDKEHLGWIKDCGRGNHQWQLNFYRSPDGPHHYHCFYCGIGHDLQIRETFGFRKVNLKVPKDWIDQLEPNDTEFYSSSI